MTLAQLSRSDAAVSPDGVQRRRVALVSTALLLLLGASPIFAHHVAGRLVGDLLSGIDHLGSICLTALHLLLLPVHRLSHIVIYAGVAWALWNRGRAWWKLRNTLSLLDARPARQGDAFWEAAVAARVEPGLLRIVDGLPNPAFTAGWIRPRIYLAAALGSQLSGEQLRAVVAHEGAHVARRDPLRLFLLRLLASTLFWMPALRRLEEDVRDEAEVLADDVAAASDPLTLASAILVLAEWRCPAKPDASVAFVPDTLLDRRIRRLAGEPAVVRSHVTRQSLAGAMLALGLVWPAGIIMAHPVQVAVAEHCAHHRGNAFAHLLCVGSPFSLSRHRDCPHGSAGGVS